MDILLFMFIILLWFEISKLESNNDFFCVNNHTA